jgi:predicted transcriptional regulator of viral defense system
MSAMRKKNKSEKILNIARGKKLFRLNDLKDIKGAGVYLSELVENGELIKIGRGLYGLPEIYFNENQTILETAKLVPNGIICLLSALRFHEVTTQNPFEIWIAIERKAWIPQVETLPLRITFFTGKAFSEGIETHIIEGISLRVYNPAKTVADCFKYRNKVGLDVALEALRDVWRQKKATMDEIWHYAKICRMTNIMRPYLESLV